MAIVSAQRVNYNRPNPHIRVGRPKKPTKIATAVEINKINTAITKLNEAKTSINEAHYLYLLSESMKIARDLWRGRND